MSPVSEEQINIAAVAAIDIQYVRLDLIDPSSLNPRKTFLDGQLEELAGSIREHGVLSPLMVRPQGDRFEIIFGERRYRASKLAGIETVPCRVENWDDTKVLELMIIENAQRVDVHPYEEAVGYKQLLDTGHYTLASLAERLGKSERTVGRRVRLANLTDDAAKFCFEREAPVSVMELASTLLADDQYQSLYNYYTTATWQAKTFPGYRQHVQERYVYDLSKAIWKLDDADLLPQAGACSGCPFNSGTGGSLFAGLDAEGSEPGESRCTKGECFRAKLDAFYDAKIAATISKLEKKGLEFVRLSGDYHGTEDLNGGIGWKDFDNATKETEGAKRGVYVCRNEKAGKEEWIVFRKAGANGSVKPHAERLEDIRKQRIERAYRFFLYTDLIECFDAWCASGTPFLGKGEDQKVFVEATRILVASLTYDQPSFSDHKAPKNMCHPGFSAAGDSLGLNHTIKGAARLSQTPDSVPHLYRALFIQATHREIRYGDYAEYNFEPVTLESFAKLAGIDLAVVRARAEQEFPPKKPKVEKPDGSVGGGKEA